MKMKRVLAMGVALMLILGLAGTAMAGNDKAKQSRERFESEVRVESETEEADEVEEADEAEDVEEPGDDVNGDDALDAGLSQGAVHYELVIDYKATVEVPPTESGGSGAMTLTAVRGSQVETFEASIPWGLTNEEAIQYISDAFAPMVGEAFGIEVNSFKVLSFSFDAETSVTHATFMVIHGKAPVKVMKKAAAALGIQAPKVNHAAKTR